MPAPPIGNSDCLRSDDVLQQLVTRNVEKYQKAAGGPEITYADVDPVISTVARFEWRVTIGSCSCSTEPAGLLSGNTQIPLRGISLCRSL
jgi:hypothetical protein